MQAKSSPVTTVNIDYANCGLAKTLEIIGSKWTLMILYGLMSGTKRFGELQSELGVSPRTLTARLVQLEKDGIIAKKAYAEVPPRVEYSLTAKGKSLNKIVTELCRWGDTRC